MAACKPSGAPVQQKYDRPRAANKEHCRSSKDASVPRTLLGTVDFFIVRTMVLLSLALVHARLAHKRWVLAQFSAGHQCGAVGMPSSVANVHIGTWSRKTISCSACGDIMDKTTLSSAVHAWLSGSSHRVQVLCVLNEHLYRLQP